MQLSSRGEVGAFTVQGVEGSGGRRNPSAVRAIARAIPRSRDSSQRLATSCTPIGKPSVSRAQGSTRAGCPV